MEHHCNRTHREQVYRAYILRASVGEFDNSELIDRILTLRKEKAQLLGFETTPISAWIRKWQTAWPPFRKCFPNWCRPPGSRPGRAG
jgi:Zn-dependent oligopeptidase